MRVDITVPNFDDSSNEVTLSSWYKKVGDKISKNEVIADAETAVVACGITSSYDCILVKIFANEGDIISQGEKIAVIETDLNTDISDIAKEQEIKEEKEISSVIASQIQEEKNEIKDSVNEPESYYSLSVPLGDKAVEEKIIEDFSEHTEEKCLSILKNAETQAIEEAQKLKEKIIEETQKQALLQAEELKAKILKEYEEKATKDAAEMHQKIIDGSLQEAENTKAKLIEEAKEKALQEAENLKNEIMENAEKKAKNEAESTIENAISLAKEESKFKAELISKDIIEKAISESKLEAKAIKKDIIHSAKKYAAKESESIVKDVIKDAKARSRLQAEELIESTTQLALCEAHSFRKEILENTKNDVKETANLLLSSFIKEINKGIGKNIKSLHESNISEDQLCDSYINETNKEEKQMVNESMETSNSGINQCKDTLNCNDIEPELRNEIVMGENYQAEEQSEIIRKLLNIESENNSEVYADNWNKPKFFESQGDYNEPIDMLKRRISQKMKDSYDTSVISTVSNEVDMSAILALEKIFGKAFSKKHNTRLGFTPFFISASIAALRQYRIFNAHIHNDEIIYKNNFDISIITCGNDGISAPVVRHADKLSIAEVEKSMISLSKRAIEGTLSIEEVSGGTFTVINAGIYGSLIGTDLLTPPQVATLSVHKMHNRPIATTSNGMGIKPMLYISLSYDHRVSDTRKASEFLSNIKNYVENPGWQILDL